MPSNSHTLRFPDPLWEDAQAAAKRSSESVNVVLIRALQDYVERVSWRDRALAAEAELAALRATIS